MENILMFRHIKPPQLQNCCTAAHISFHAWIHCREFPRKQLKVGAKPMPSFYKRCAFTLHNLAENPPEARRQLLQREGGLGCGVERSGRGAGGH